ncbi:tape measure protein [Lactiplantibacillus plantarum]|uniref:tape measure protein n=1 Tax=Lactiplantibacillus plantarum TaxID=1590 RepID=UPI002FDA106A
MADGKVTIDVLMNTKSFMSDRERVNNLMKTLGSDAGNQMDESFANNANKVKNEAERTHSKIKAEFNSPVEAKLVAKAEEAGITNFKQLLNRVPKQARTELMAKAEKGEAIDWENTMRKMPRSVTTRMKLDKGQASEGLTTLKKQSESTEHSFSHLKEIMAGTFLGGAIQAGVQGLVMGLKNAAKAGMEYNKEQDTMKTVWTALTTEAPKDGKELIDYINSLSQHSIYAADTINRMSQSFYHVHSNVKETKDWTNAFVALGSTLHMSNDALAESGEQFAKIVAGGKASAEDMSVMINRFPMFGEALQKATGKSMKQLYAMSAAGKLTATQFTEALDYLGKKYKDGTSEAMTSFQGMSMYIKSRWSVLTGNIMASSFKMSKGVAKDMRNLLSDDMLKKYAKIASGAISTVMTWFVKLIKYIDGHKDTIVDIIGNLGKILGIIGKTVWKTFSDIIYDIARMFGLVGKKAQESKDPLDKIDDALKNLSKNQELIENLTKAFIAMFALKKGIEFIGMLSSLRKSLIETAAVSKMVDLFGGGGFTVGGGKAVTKEAGETAATAGSSKVLGRLFSKGGATSTAELEAASGLGGGKAMMAARGLAKAVPYMSIAASLPELFGTTKATLGKHLGGFTGSVGGAAAGAAAGSAVMPVVGTAVGGVIGGFAGSKLGQSIGGGIQKGITRTFPKLTSKMSDLGHDMSKKFSSSFKPKPSLNDKQFSRSYTSLTKQLNKNAKIKFKVTTDRSSINKAQRVTDDTYKKMSKSVDKYYGHKRQMSIKDYATLVQNGSMTEKEANKLLNKAKENYSKQEKAQKNNIEKMKKDSDSYYSKLGKAESQKNKELAAARKKDGNNHAKYLADKKKIEEKFQKQTAGDRKKYLAQLAKDENKSNDAVTKATKISSGKQLDILESLKDHKGKLSKQQMTESIRNSAQERDKTIDNANKQRDKSVSAAKNKYKETVAAADKERYENGTMSRKQYEEVVSKARKQRDDSIDAADSQKNKTVKKAEETHTKVVNEATKQAGEHKGAVDTETGDVKGSWNEFIDNMRGMWNGMIGGINGVLHALNKKWGNIPTWKKHAAGLNGSMGEHTALVGEEGFEYMGTSDGSITPIGVDGPEIRNIPAGASILPHGMSVEFAQMAKGLPGYKIGLPGWLTNTFSALKKGVEGAADLVSEGASGVVNKIANATGIGKLAKTFSDNTTAFGAIASGAKSSLIDNAIKYVKSFFEKFSDDSGGSYDGAKGHYNPSLIEKAAKEMHAWPLPTGFSQALQATIMSESGGKSVIQTIHDMNSGGNEAGGILQFTPGTFNAFAMPGHKNRMNPLDSLLAFFNNSDWRNSIGHTSILGVPKIDWLHSGPQGHRRFANGGWGDPNKVNIFNEVPGEPEVAINPARDSADSLIVEAARARAAKDPNGLIAKAMRVVGNAKAGIQRTAPSFASRSVAQVAANQSAQSKANSDLSGNLDLTIKLDSWTLAKAQYPKLKLLKANQIILSQNGGAIR